ncbi:MAG: hypothetical protein AAFX02_09690 [Pseudomonadota bacterium]
MVKYGFFKLISTMHRQLILLLSAISILAIATVPAHAGDADVLEAEITKTGDRTYTISVTVEHGDDGWDHYADAWEVVGPDGKVIAKRILAHPHVNEQPFTRSKSGIKIPMGIDVVTIRAHDLEHGYGGAEIKLSVPE